MTRDNADASMNLFGCVMDQAILDWKNRPGHSRPPTAADRTDCLHPLAAGRWPLTAAL